MTTNYPTAYKTESAVEKQRKERPGFQRPAPKPRPRPANDNKPASKPIKFPNSGLAGRRAFARRLAGWATKAHPALRALGYAYDAYQYFRYFPETPGGYDFPGTGWTVEADCGSKNNLNQTQFSAGSCGTVATVANQTWNDRAGKFVETSSRFYAYFYSVPWFPHPSFTQATRHYKAYIEKPFVDPLVAGAPALYRVIKPRKVPSHDPFDLPISTPTNPSVNPVPTPFAPPFPAIPHRQPNPWRNAQEQTITGPAPRPRKRPEQISDVVPPQSIDFPPRPRANPRTASGATPSGPRMPEPPKTGGDKPKTKERKATAGFKGKRLLLRGLNLVTETGDVINAFYGALPWYRRNKGDNPIEKAQKVYDHFDELDLEVAIENLIINEIIDAGFGKAGQALKPLNRELGRPLGVQSGPAL